MNRTVEAVRTHLAAIQSPLYEIGVFFPPVEGRAESKMLLRTWDEAALCRSIPWLRAKNAEGAAIYVRPHGEHPYSLIDDLNAAGVQRLTAEGFAPAIVVETSPGNFQAWLNHGEVLDKRTSTTAARALAERHGGDPGAADWRHFGRLAGFTNRKPQYLQASGLYPFVQMADYNPGVIYTGAASFLRDVRNTFHEQHLSSGGVPAPRAMKGHLKTIDDFRADPVYGGDGNRIDFAFALYALAHGADEGSVRTAIQTRDLTKKGSPARQSAYVLRTVTKARDRVAAQHGR